MDHTLHHVVHSLHPSGGGVPMVAVQVAAAQAEAKALVHLHCLRPAAEPPSADDDLAVVLEGLPGLELVQLHRHSSIRLMRQSLRSLAEVPSVFHLHGVWDLPLLVAARAADRGRRPYVVTPHGMLDPWSLGQSRWKKRAALLFAHRRLLNRAAFIQALNEDEKRLMAPLRLWSRVEVVPNGVHLPDMTPERARAVLAQIDSQLESGMFFLFLARLHYKKGLDILMDAYERLPESPPPWPLVIAGPDDGMGAEIRRRAEAGGFPGRVILPGPQYGETKAALLQTAGAVVLPSRQEGFSLTILEAMAAGVPVIISDQCHFSEVALNQAGRVVPVDVSAFRESMLNTLCIGPEARRSQGSNGRRLVETGFTWGNVAKELLGLYRAVSHSE